MLHGISSVAAGAALWAKQCVTRSALSVKEV